MFSKYPDMISIGTNMRKCRNQFFFIIEDNCFEKLYRTDYDPIEEIYTPQEISSLPLLTYKDEEKFNVIEKFLSDKKIDHKISGKNIMIYDKEHYEKKDLVAPLYERKGSYFIKKSNSYTGKIYTQKTIDKACEVFLKYRKAIKNEEILYDVEKLTLDNGISAYLERYPLSPVLYLDKSRYYVLDLSGDPNPDDMYNEYSYTYIIKKTLDNGFACGGSYLVFDKEKIAEHLHNGDVNCTLPSRELASIIIGKGGEGIKELSFKLGVKRLIINTPPEKNKKVV